MDGGNQINALPFIRAKVNPDIFSRSFQITIGSVCPRSTPPLAVAGIIPIGCAYLVGFIVTAAQFNPFAVFVQHINTFALGQPLAISETNH